MKAKAFTRFVGGIAAAAVFLAGCGSHTGAPVTPQGIDPASARQDSTAHGKNGAVTTAFTVKGRSLLLDGKPFFVKGMDYSPAQINSWPDGNPLDDANEPIWSVDLQEMRAAGVNSIKVYNMTLKSFTPLLPIMGPNFKLEKYETGKIDKFLKAAWNGGKDPIYVVLSLAFNGADVTKPNYSKTFAQAFELAGKEYSAYPAFMGVSIGNEINGSDVIAQAAWWNGLNTMVDGLERGYKEAGAEKISTTTMVDDSLKTVIAGEKNKFKVDVWGVNSYRGITFTDIWKQFEKYTQKPSIISEYGYSTAWYPKSSAKYDDNLHYCPQDTYPPGTDQGPEWGLPGVRPWEGARELPETGNPNVKDYVELVKANAAEIYEHSIGQTGSEIVGSGGYYFEWNDEWWKSGWPNDPHIGGEGNKITSNAVFPGCYRDESWFGLNSVKKTGSGDAYFPNRTPDKRVPKPALKALINVWASEQ